MNELAAMVGFAFVGTVSPGPNNAVLWGSGLTFGFRRTIPHVLGTAVGMAVLVVAIAAGVGVLFDAVPAAEVALKVIGSAYLLYVAFLVLGAGGVGRAAVPRPFTVWQAAAFQFANPKAWVFALAVVGTFLPRAVPRAVAVALLTSTLIVIVVVSSAVWAAGGAALGRVVDDERKRRGVGVVLAVLLVASVVLLWV